MPHNQDKSTTTQIVNAPKNTLPFSDPNPIMNKIGNENEWKLA